MRSKLDPVLRETLEGREPHEGGTDGPAEPSPPLEVLIALVGPPTATDVDELMARGLTIRSSIGEILTGTVALDDVDAVSDYDAVVAIEGGRALGLDGPGDEDQLPPLDIDDLTE